MPAKRLSMRKIKDVLRLCWGQGLSKRQAAMSCGMSRPAVDGYLRRAEAAGLRWPLPAELDDGALERLLFPLSPPAPDTARGAPDWSEVHRELTRPGVTLLLLWQEYRRTHPHGYQYTWFCQQYRAWTGKLDLVMRQTHRAGEKLFVDYAGMRAQVIDPATGVVREANIFVAVLGASNYTYAEATWTQGLADWIGARVVLPTSAGCRKWWCRTIYAPALPRRTGMSRTSTPPTRTHYGVAVIPARVRRPRDKAKAEVGVQVVERWILAALRHRQCFSLAELNRAIGELLARLNRRPFRKLPGKRNWINRPCAPCRSNRTSTRSGSRPGSISITTSRPRPLLLRPPCAHQKTGGRAYHCQHHRVLPPRPAASHRRSYQKARHTTVTAHMPEAHRQAGEWSPERLERWAMRIGSATARLVRSRLTARDTRSRLTAAAWESCAWVKPTAMTGRPPAGAPSPWAASYKSIESILRHGLDRQPLAEQTESELPADHDNIRGSTYYH